MWGIEHPRRHSLQVQEDTACTRLDCCRHLHKIVSTQSLPPEMGARFIFFGQACRRFLSPGWLCSSQKRGTSSPILARRHTQTLTSHHHRRVIKPSFSIDPLLVPYMVKRIKVIQRAGMCKLGELYHVCRGFFCSSTNTCGVSCVEFPLLPLCFSANIPGVKVVEALPRGSWTVVAFHHPFMKVNDAYMWFIVQSLPPFAASNDLLGN